MRAIRFHRFGGPEELRLDDVPEPAPADGEVLVRVRFAGVNPVDGKVLAGQFPNATPPRVPGADFAGVVVRGAGFAPGAEVLGSGAGTGVTRDGAYAELVAVPRECVVLRPEALPAERAAGLGIVFLTAWLAVVDGAAVRADETVLVHGAGGAVGHASVLLAARSARARVLAVVSSEAGAARARAAGAAEVIDRTRSDVWAEARRLTDGRGPDVILDVVGGAVFEASVAALAPRGRLVSIGVSAGESGRVALDLPSFYRANKRIVGVNTGALPLAERGRILGEVVGEIARGAWAAPEVTVLPLADAPRALARTLEREGAHGKLVLAVGG